MWVEVILKRKTFMLIFPNWFDENFEVNYQFREVLMHYSELKRF